MYPVIQLGSRIFLPSYLVIISLIFSTHVFWVIRRAQKFKFERNLALDVTMAVMVGSFVGARLFHVIWEEPTYYWEDLRRILYFWRGGFVFYGGLLGGIAGGLFILRKERKNWFSWLDLFAPIIASGYGFGRMACFFAGCCYGKPTQMPWGVIFPAGVEAPEGVCIHPTQLYAVGWEFALLFLLLKLEGREYFKRPGQMFFTWLALHALGRFWQEFFRQDFRGPQLFGVTISMFISGVLFLFALFVLRVVKIRRG